MNAMKILAVRLIAMISRYFVSRLIARTKSRRRTTESTARKIFFEISSLMKIVLSSDVLML